LPITLILQLRPLHSCVTNSSSVPLFSHFTVEVTLFGFTNI
jgi:hypothetical protein